MDSKLEEAVDLILEMGYCSVSAIQRNLMLGYNRACGIIAEMEKLKIVGPARGTRPRDVLIVSKDELGELPTHARGDG